MADPRTITIHGVRPPVRIPRANVYFAFADGRFSYDCVSCQGLCCRGNGYRGDLADIQRQLSERPALSFFMERKAAAGFIGVRNCPPGCFFLNEQNLCSFHVEHGYEAKPQTCRLFPFNTITITKNYLIVAPHTGLCPLSVTTDGDQSPLSAHERLFEEMANKGIVGSITTTDAAEVDAGVAIGLERAIVALTECAETSSNYLSFAHAQLKATQAALGRDNHGGLDAFRDLLWTVLGRSPRKDSLENPVLARTLASVTPALRSRVAFLGSAEVPAHVRIDLERVPHMMLALHTMAAFALEAGQRQITFQTLSYLFRENIELLVMCAHLDCQMSWLGDDKIEWELAYDREAQLRYLGIVRSLLSQGSGGDSLGQILIRHSHEDAVDRMFFLRAVARRLAGRVARSQTRSSWRPRAALRRWAIGNFSADILASVAESRAKRKSVHQKSL